MTSVGLHRELTFEEAIRAPERKIEPPYRPFTELQRDPKLMALNFRASLNEVREHELRAMLHRRRMEDVREVAARNGIPVGQVLAAEPRCAHCGKTAKECGMPRLPKCEGCLCARYCCVEHQRADWHKHKHECDW